MMFILSSFNFLGTVPQRSTRIKSGLFQSSSFTTVKKLPQLDPVYAEITEAVRLIDFQCEKLVNFLASVKIDSSSKICDWFYVEDQFHKKLRKFTTKSSGNSHKQCRETVSTAVQNVQNDNSEIVNSGVKGNIESQSARYGSLDLLEHENPASSFSSKSTEFVQKKPMSIFSQIIAFEKFAKSSISGNILLHINSQNELFLGGYGRSYHGQRRGFKTSRRVVEPAASEQGLSDLMRALINYCTKEGISLKLEKSGEGSGKYKNIGWLNAVFVASRLLIWIFVLGLVAVLGRHLISFVRGEMVSIDGQKTGVKFDDAKGMDEAKEELRFVVEFLRNPEKFSRLGGKLPAGILLQGPPGTGKTLLARAVAGEADVSFFHTCGSEFEEILVGQGARRVRHLFRKARMLKPAVIFIDEIDTVGGKRASTSLQPFANNTINQLLSEMDGFVQNEQIVVIGATNRGSDLDQALLRPGRFDFQIELQPPDVKGREEILELYLGKVSSKDIDVPRFAKLTAGLSGAHLKNIVNQAALMAAVDNSQYVTNEYMERAIDKIMMGSELKSLVRTDEMNRMVAYHESGHALVAHLTTRANPPGRISIIPRNKVKGYTSVIPESEDHFTKARLLAQIDVLLGGRVAEELFLGPDNVTDGCSDDLDKATEIATMMVERFGMSESVGLRTYRSSEPALIKLGKLDNEEVDKEVKRIIKESYERTKNLLTKHSKELHQLAQKLIEKETLGTDDIVSILGERKPRSPIFEIK